FPHEHQAAPGGPEAPSRTAPRVVAHTDLPRFENSGNALLGVATASLGASSFEVWRSSIAAGSRTPSHTHETEEIFVVLAGQGRAHIGDQVFDFVAPATVIAPAG